MIQSEISFSQATKIRKEIQLKTKEERLDIIEEIETSSFEMYEATDINMFAASLNITPNKVREIHLKANRELTKNDLIHTFNNDDTDSLLYFY